MLEFISSVLMKGQPVCIPGLNNETVKTGWRILAIADADLRQHRG